MFHGHYDFCAWGRYQVHCSAHTFYQFSLIEQKTKQNWVCSNVLKNVESKFTGIIQLAKSPYCDTSIAPNTVKSKWPLNDKYKKNIIVFVVNHACGIVKLPSYHCKAVFATKKTTTGYNRYCFFAGVDQIWIYRFF